MDADADDDVSSNDNSSCKSEDTASTVSDGDMSIMEDLCIESIALSF